VGENSTVVEPVTPVPVRVTRCGLPVALSKMDRSWVSCDSTVGVNVTLIVQTPPPAGRVPTQLSVSVKSPPAVMLVICSGTVPAFLRVTTEGRFIEVTVLLVPLATFPKAIFCGVKATAGRLLWAIMETKALPTPVLFPGCPW